MMNRLMEICLMETKLLNLKLPVFNPRFNSLPLSQLATFKSIWSRIVAALRWTVEAMEAKPPPNLRLSSGSYYFIVLL